MKDYKYFLRESFEYPVLQNDSELKERVSSPLELFFDLMLVAIFGVVAHQFYHITVIELLLAFSLFFATFFVWININMFMMRFYSASYLIRIGLMSTMLPLFMIASVEDISSPEGIRVISIGLFLSRIILIILWYIVALKNPKVTNEIFKKAVKIDIVGYIIGAIVGAIPFFVPNEYVLIVAILLGSVAEIGYDQIMYKSVSIRESKGMPLLDIDLLNERILLFIILIFGEGVLSSFSIFSEHSTNNTEHIFLGIVVFISVFLFYLRVYEEWVMRKFLSKMETAQITRVLLIAFLQLSLYSILNAILVQKGFVDISFRVVLSIVLMIISGGHHSADLQDLKSTQTSDEEKKFARVDIATLYPMYILSVLVLFISSKIVIILIVFAYFIIHIIPVPYRYKLFKTRVE
jgi:low temperature requirement protein LtrA